MTDPAPAYAQAIDQLRRERDALRAQFEAVTAERDAAIAAREHPAAARNREPEDHVSRRHRRGGEDAMTLESAAVEFLRASAAWSKAKQTTRNLRCEHEEAAEYDHAGRVIGPPTGPCPYELGSAADEDWCPNCQMREPLMADRRAALKTYNQARRRAMRLLKKEAP